MSPTACVPRRLAEIVALTVGLGLAGCSPSETPAPTALDMLSSEEGGRPARSPAPDAATARFEVDYIEFTINHHGMGVMMDALCVEKALHEVLRHMCQQGIETQQREIRLSQGWLQAWYGKTHKPQMKPEDRRMLARLAALTGPEFEFEFIKMLRHHHQQIIRVSQHAVERVHHAELRQLASDIVAMQSKDVAQLTSWLCAWYNLCHHAAG